MLTRRSLLASAGAGVIAAHVSPARAAAKLGEDGLYHLDWYLESFLDLADDLTAATAKGKRFAIMWGLKGCPACKRMHLVHFADPKIEAYVRDNFEILHLNHIGARIVTDFDGRKLGEKALAASYGIQFTPSIQFFPEDAASSAARSERRARSRVCRGCSIRPNSSACSAMCGRRPTRRRRSPIGSRSRRDRTARFSRGVPLHPAFPIYLFTGDSGSNSSATRSLICCSVRYLLTPKRGMFEQACSACEL